MTIREAIDKYLLEMGYDICDICAYRTECTCDYSPCEDEPDTDIINFEELYDIIYPTPTDDD